MESIQNDAVVAIHYVLRDDDKEIIDSSEGSEPLTYLHGHGQIVPGLEQTLMGKRAGDSLQTSVSADQGYGEYRNELCFDAARKDFAPDANFEVGAMFELRDQDGESFIVQVVGIEGDTISLDGNHPLAGQTLHFEVNVVSVRQATQEELEHGHVHGEGSGCSH